MKVEKTFYYCGVFNIEDYDEYPWYFHYEGQYISNSGRFCKFEKAAEFPTKQEAIEFFDGWKKKNKKRSVYKLHIVRCNKTVDDPDITPYPDNHPMYLVDASNLRSTYKNTARQYFFDIPPWQSKATIKKHREILLKEFGFDISKSLPDELRLQKIKRIFTDPIDKPSELKAL